MQPSKVTPTKLKKLILPVIMAGLCPMITSSPGIGKSDIVKHVAEEHNLEVIDLRLSTIDPTNLTGYLVPNRDTDRADFMPPALFPLKGDKLPEGKDGWLLFLDEITAAVPAIQAAAYKVILDRMIGEHHLHENVVVAAAGNSIKDGAVAFKMSTALQSRMVHFSLVPDKDEWLAWAMRNNVANPVISFIEFRPELLNNFDPKHSDLTFACSRTTEMLSKVYKNIPKGEDPSAYEWTPLYTGTVGMGAGVEFRTFLEVYKDLVRFSDIEDDPENTPVSNDPSVLYALAGVIAENVTLKNITNVMKYIVKLPIEHQVSTISKINIRDSSFVGHPALQQWLSTSSERLY